MRKGNPSEDSTKLTHTSNQATARKSSARSLRGSLSSRRVDSGSCSPVPPNVYHERAANIELDSHTCPPVDALYLHSGGRTWGSGCSIWCASDTQSELQDAQQVASCMYRLSGPAITVVSVGKFAQADFDAADSFQDKYLKPLGIFAFIGEIAKVWTLP